MLTGSISFAQSSVIVDPGLNTIITAMDANPGDTLILLKGKEYVLEDSGSPAVYVSWDDTQNFCKKLGSGFRLPTEAEWEYACRSGSTTEYNFGDSASGLGGHAWYDENANGVGEKYAHKVGLKQSNAWGLYDMHGNVWEWCQDWYGDYSSGSASNPRGPSSGSYRVFRGGSWFYGPTNCRSASRSWSTPGYRSSRLGFRLCRSAR